MFLKLKEETRETVLKLDHFCSAIKSIGCGSHELLEQVKQIPTECDPLALAIINMLNPFSDASEFVSPIGKYEETIKAMFEQRGSKDVELLIPLIPTMSKDEIIRRLPLFIDASHDSFSNAIGLIMQRPDFKIAPDYNTLSPKEFLIEVHVLGLTDQQVMKTTEECLKSPKFNKKDLASVWQKIMEARNTKQPFFHLVCPSFSPPLLLLISCF